MRRDYFRERWTIISEGRVSRPKETFRAKGHISDNCPFCPGNEHLTPPEIARIINGNKWQARTFSNKFPIVAKTLEKTDKNWKTLSTEGVHEVIVETPNHFALTSKLSVKEFKMLLSFFKERVNDLEKSKNIQYVEIFKNQGSEAGASLLHPHFQLIGLNIIPPKVQEKINHSYQGDCIYCKIIKVDGGSARVVLENNYFIAFCPFAPSNTHELWIVSKKHLRNFNDMDNNDIVALSEILKEALTAVEKQVANYNLIINFGPKNEDFHFHIEILPQFEHAVRAGFELGTGFSVVSSSPEVSAKLYLSGTSPNNNQGRQK